MKHDLLLILDSNALVHRAYHAVPPTLKTKDGEPTNAVFGFASSLLSAMETLKPTHIAACFDPPGRTFRHEEYADYKARRPKGSDELHSQLRRAHDLVAAFGIPVYEVPGYEADDAIGTIVKKMAPKDIEIIIATGDKDTLQLLNGKVKVWTLRQGIKNAVLYDKETLKEEKGLTPEGFLLAKALRGDPSDNIPGVPGVGEVTANKIGAHFSDPEALIKALKNGQIDELIPEKVRTKLLDNEGIIKDSFKLVKIDTNVPLKFKFTDTALKNVDYAKVESMFRALEFTSLLRRLPEKSNTLFRVEDKKEIAINGHYVAITEHNFENLLREIQQAIVIALDTETDRIDNVNQKLVGLSVAMQEKEAFYLPFGHKEGGNLPLKYLNKFIKAIPPKSVIAGHNFKFDLHTLRNAGVDIENPIFDTMVAAHILDPGRGNISLTDIAFVEFGITMQLITDLIGSGKNQITMADVDIKRTTHYAAEDADLTLCLYNHTKPRMDAHPAKKLFYDVEMPLLSILCDMERRGICLNSGILKEQGKKLKESLKDLERDIYKLAGGPFNINSPAQMTDVLFSRLKIQSVGLRRRQHGPSTAFKELEKLKNLHPIIRQIMEYREKAKLVSTYIDALPNLTDKKTGRIHTTFSQTTVSSGRLSSYNPNLQNIPVKSKEGKAIRQAFTAGSGKILLSADYSQIELRVVAYFSKDAELRKAFSKGADVHTWTAAQLFGIPQNEVTPEQRYTAKAINFSIIYGVSAFGLSENARLDRAEAQRFIDRYFAVFTGVKRYMEERIQMAKDKGYAETLMGLRLPLSDIESGQANLQRYAERVAINMPAQGTAAEILKSAMLKLNNLPHADLLLTVHDELVFEVDKGYEKEIAQKVKETMANAISLDVPLAAEVKSGHSWGEMEKLI